MIIAILNGRGSLAAVAHDRGLPNIMILATGGTIAGRAATGTQARYTSGAVTIDTMLAAVPAIKDLASLKGGTNLQCRVTLGACCFWCVLWDE